MAENQLQCATFKLAQEPQGKILQKSFTLHSIRLTVHLQLDYLSNYYRHFHLDTILTLPKKIRIFTTQLYACKQKYTHRRPPTINNHYFVILRLK